MQRSHAIPTFYFPTSPCVPFRSAPFRSAPFRSVRRRFRGVAENSNERTNERFERRNERQNETKRNETNERSPPSHSLTHHHISHPCFKCVAACFLSQTTFTALPLRTVVTLLVIDAVSAFRNTLLSQKIFSWRYCITILESSLFVVRRHRKLLQSSVHGDTVGSVIVSDVVSALRSKTLLENIDYGGTIYGHGQSLVVRCRS